MIPPRVSGVDPVLRTLLEHSITADGDFDPGLYRWLSTEASAEEGAALLHAVLPAYRQAAEQWRQIERIAVAGAAG